MSGAVTSYRERYVATNLADVIAVQGRRRNWLAERAGVSESLLSKIISGTKTADRVLGERIADLLGVPFGVLFEFRERNEFVSPAEQ
jgi:hypothetical protein